MCTFSESGLAALGEETECCIEAAEAVARTAGSFPGTAGTGRCDFGAAETVETGCYDCRGSGAGAELGLAALGGEAVGCEVAALLVLAVAALMDLEWQSEYFLSPMR